MGRSSVFARAWGAQAQEGRRAGDGLSGANQTNKTGSNMNLMFTLFGSGKHLVGVNKSLKYFFNHPEMSVSPSANVAFRTAAGKPRMETAWSYVLTTDTPRGTGVLESAASLQSSAIFVVFVFICMFRSKGSVVKYI